MATVATGFIQGAEPKPELARQAVLEAMAKLGVSMANSVLLFLTPPFSRDLTATIRAVAGAANCTNVVGCVAAGVFTEQGYAAKTPAVAVMALSGDVNVTHQDTVAGLMMSLTSSDSLSTHWLSQEFRRFGGLSAGGIWRNAKGLLVEACEVSFEGVSAVTAVAQGIEYMSDPQLITATQGHEVVFVGGKPALQTFQQAFQHDTLDFNKLSFSHAFACIAESLEAAQHGQYQLASLVGGSVCNRSVMLAQAAEAGQWLCWARSTVFQDCEAMTENVAQTLDFGLLFSSPERGAGFNGSNRDLIHFQQHFPEVPMIGIEAASVIAAVEGRNQMLPYSAALGLFTRSSHV